MKEKLFLGFVIAFATVTISLTAWHFASPSLAWCWACKPTACSFDTDCDPMCHCHKGKYEINGVCVSD